MKAISIRQPFAALICEGRKRHEFRSWTTEYRGPLAIHAALTRDLAAYEALGRDPTDPIGALVAVCDLALIQEWLGAPRRYAWHLTNINKLPNPVPYRGRLYLFDVPDHIIAAEIQERKER